MCLAIRSLPPKATRTFKRPKKSRTVYKVYNRWGTGPKARYYPIFINTDREVNVSRPVSSDRRDVKLTKEEMAKMNVYKGIHVFTRLQAAIILRDRTWAMTNRVILKMRGEPEDFVASNKQTSEAVYRKLTPICEIK